MPPKKRGNVVVGTVSTRSTRRQSVVHLNVPKPRKTRQKKLLNQEEDSEKPQTVINDILNEWSDNEGDDKEYAEDSFDKLKSEVEKYIPDSVPSPVNEAENVDSGDSSDFKTLDMEISSKAEPQPEVDVDEKEHDSLEEKLESLGEVDTTECSIECVTEELGMSLAENESGDNLASADSKMETDEITEHNSDQEQNEICDNSRLQEILEGDSDDHLEPEQSTQQSHSEDKSLEVSEESIKENSSNNEFEEISESVKEMQISDKTNINNDPLLNTLTEHNKQVEKDVFDRFEVEIQESVKENFEFDKPNENSEEMEVHEEIQEVTIKLNTEEEKDKTQEAPNEDQNSLVPSPALDQPIKQEDTEEVSKSDLDSSSVPEQKDNKKNKNKKKEDKNKKPKLIKKSPVKIKLTPSKERKPKEPKLKAKQTKEAVPKKLLNKKTKEGKKMKNEEGEKKEEDENSIRRSSRIKSISVMKKKTKGHGLVKSKSDSMLELESTEAPEPERLSIAIKQTPEKKKRSRWSKTGEQEIKDESKNQERIINQINEKPVELPEDHKEVERRLKQFIHLEENKYLTERISCKEAKKMVCDCFLTQEEIESGDYGCGDDCLNRLLMIECGPFCPVNDRCTNKRFQKGQFAPVEVFKTEKKGLGLRAAANIPYGEFILEYVGEVLDSDEFEKRAEEYSKDKNIHYYFMALRADAVIDATMKGNISRFINHSCDPNAETQKWTVNGELRIGFFSTRTILAGEEITFDYRFERYGKEAQKCFCDASCCRGWLGGQPGEDYSEEDEEEDEEEDDQEAEGSKDDSKIKVEGMDTSEAQESSKEGTETAPDVKIDAPAKPAKAAVKRAPRKKRQPRKKVVFEELDALDDEIDMLVETGLKNQAHTLKLSRFMVRAKEQAQRSKLLRILRRGELACRRLFLDYHGLRLMHGYMTDAQHLVRNDKKFEYCRLELLQTLATLPIPNKTMLQDSKVLETVEKWASDKYLNSPGDSDSNSPKIDEAQNQEVKSEAMEVQTVKDENDTKYEEEIMALALKLLQEWSNLKETFRIPKKERIEQMKEHEREANKKYEASYGGDENDRKLSSRYRNMKYKFDREHKGSKNEELDRNNPIAKLEKYERRRLYAIQYEIKEEERRRKQRELWRQHEQNCMLLGTDPRFTAPFDPSRGFQCIWNPQIGQWQNYPIPPGQNVFPQMGIPPPQLQKTLPNYGYGSGVTAQNMQQILNIPGLPSAQQLQGVLQSKPIAQIPFADPKDGSEPVKFMGPIPPPVKLPKKWKCAKDKYGRPYYYHIKLRKSQWEPPPLSEPIIENDESSELSSSSESSSETSDSSSDTDSDDEIDDAKLLLQVKKQMEKAAKLTMSKRLPPRVVKTDDSSTPSPEDKEEAEVEEKSTEAKPEEEETDELSSIDIRLKEQFDVLKESKAPPKKKKRTGLVQEMIISPRTEEDKMQFREDMKRYKMNKEKLRRQKELIMQQTKKQVREGTSEAKKPKEKEKEKRPKVTVKVKVKEGIDANSEAARKIKETFRANMAHTVVSVLNNYRKPDCKEGRITNTDDFKHLARKLTHFVMLKEIKHIASIEDLECTENVKSKAREYIKKYMSKFGETYQKRADEPEFKD